MSDRKVKIKGLGGKRKLKGKIEIPYSKNLMIPALAASLLFEDEYIIENVPKLSDIDSLSKVIEMMGSRVENGSNKFVIHHPDKINPNLHYSETKKTRGVIAFTGPLLARCGRCVIPSGGVGGCAIGERPIDFFISFYDKIGAKISIEGESVVCVAAEKLKGCDFTFERRSVLGTITLAMTSVLIEGKTVLHNCSLEPEVVDILSFLKSSGADIEGVGTDTITIQGRDGKLLNSKKHFYNTPDRIQTAGYILLGVLSCTNLKLTNCEPKEFESVIKLLNSIGIDGIKLEDESLSIEIPESFSLSDCKAFKVETSEYPGIPTDIQNQLIVLATQLSGESYIKENIFENRIEKQSNEICKLGADIDILNDKEVKIRGPSKLKGSNVNAIDIRNSYALVLAGILAEGDTIIGDIRFMERGYEDLINNLKSIGLDIEYL